MGIYEKVKGLRDKYKTINREINPTVEKRKMYIAVEKELFDKTEEDRDKIKEDNLSIRDRLKNQFYKLRIKLTNIRMRKATKNILNLGAEIGKYNTQKNKELKLEKQKIIDYLNGIMNLYKEDEKMRATIKKMIRELEYIDIYNIIGINMHVFETELEYGEENVSFIPKVKVQTPTNQFTIPNEVRENGVTER